MKLIVAPLSWPTYGDNESRRYAPEDICPFKTLAYYLNIFTGDKNKNLVNSMKLEMSLALAIASLPAHTQEAIWRATNLGENSPIGLDEFPFVVNEQLNQMALFNTETTQQMHRAINFDGRPSELRINLIPKNPESNGESNSQ